MTKFDRIFVFDNDKDDSDTLNNIINNIEHSEYFCFGEKGAGNHYLSHTFNLANLKYQISQNDLVLFCWSNFHRCDWFIDFKWSNEGNINSPGKYNSLLHPDLITREQCMVRDITNMYSVMTILDGIQTRHYHFKSDFVMFMKLVFKGDVNAYFELDGIVDYIRSKLTRLNGLQHELDK